MSNPRIRERRLIQAIDKLSRYYGLPSQTDDTQALIRSIQNIELSETGLIRTEGINSTDENQNSAISDFVNSLLNSPYDAYTAEVLASRLNETYNPLTSGFDSPTADIDIVEPRTETANNTIGSIIQIIGDSEEIRNFRFNFPPIFRKLKYVGIKRADPHNGISSIPILQVSDDETSRDKSLSLILINSPQLNLSNRYTKAVSLFLNGVPSLEMAKAVPYLEVNFEFPTPAVDSGNNLLAPSIYKFIMGGVTAAPDSILYSLQTANSSSNATSDTSYTGLGMEAFLSPQIIFNRKSNGTNNTNTRANEVLDPTRPILSITSFSTSEVNSYAAFGYRTASLQLTLHDRSRMADVAPFFRADLRGTTRIDIEYGWCHPDGEGLIRERRNNISPYVDLINGMRKREKFGIRNSRFSFKENGSVDITLELVTLGQSQLSSDLIITPGATQIIQDLQRLQETLSGLLSRTSLTGTEDSGSDVSSAEIRGIEALQPASDVFASGLNLTREQIRQFRALVGSGGLGRSDRAPILSQIREILTQIWGDPERRGDVGAAEAVRINIQNGIVQQIRDIVRYYRGRPSDDTNNGWPEGLPPGDPLVITTNRRSAVVGSLPGLAGAGAFRRPNSPTRPAPPSSAPPEAAPAGGGAPAAASPPAPRNPPEPTDPPDPPAEAAAGTPAGGSSTPTPAVRGGGGYPGGDLPDYLRGDDGLRNYSASLATIMTHFVGKPLLESGNFKEIQLIFYPFNENAAFASRLNIGQFEINLGMLAELLINYRLSNINRTGNMTLHEFWSFIVSNIIDNPASSSYGLWDDDGAFYRRPNAREDESETNQRFSSRPASDETTINYRISNLLRGVTPTGEFHPPQLRMVTECVAVKSENETETEVEEEPITTIRDNILKIHIYDQQTASVAGIGEVLQAERNRALSLDGRPEINDGNTTPLSEQWNAYRTGLITRASDAGIITSVSDNESRFIVVGGSNAIKNFVMNNHPYIIPGTQNSLIKTVNLASIQDEAASTLNLVNAPRTAEILTPNGEEPGGLPLQVIPVEMNITSMGCPLIGFSSQFFIDLKTGTTADDLYAINNITSQIEPGQYTTQFKLRPISGYTRYRNYLNEIEQAVQRIDEYERAEAAERETEASSRTRIGRNPRRARRTSGGSSSTPRDSE